MKALNWTAVILVIVGALNWLLYGAFGFDLVESLFGAFTAISRIIYILIGLGGVYILIYIKKYVA